MSRSKRSRNPTSSTGAKTPFQLKKEALHAQYIKQLDENTCTAEMHASAKNYNDNDNGDDSMILLAAKRRRIQRLFTNLYNQPTGRVFAMGHDDCNALGVTVTKGENNSDNDDKPLEYPPTPVLNLLPDHITHVAAGGTHSVAVAVDGTAYTWGNNDDFALGRGVIHDAETNALVVDEADSFVAGPVTTLPQTVVGIAAGDSHTLFLTIEGQVYMSGMYKDMDSGKFANLKPGQEPQEGLKQPEPVKIEICQPVFKIAAGGSSNAAILNDGSLVTWGMGQLGELGRSHSMGAESSTTKDGSLQYDLGKTFIGETYTKMVKNKDGKMVEVEDYRYYLEKINKLFLTPAHVEWQTPGKYDVLDVSIGKYHMVVVARLNNGTNRVYSCGLNFNGQLGHGDQIQRHVLCPIMALDSHGIDQVACGSHHTLFLNVFGSVVFACGRSDYGQLGLFDRKKARGAGHYISIPEQVSFPKDIGDTPISFIAVGGDTSAAVTDTGDVYTWGFNVNANTGHPSKIRHESEDIERPTKLNHMAWPSAGNSAIVSSVSLGGQHAVMVLSDEQH